MLTSGSCLAPDCGDSMSSQDQEGVDIFDKQHKGLGSAQKPQIKWKPDADELRVEDFPVGKQGSGKIKGQKSGVKTANGGTNDKESRYLG